MTYIGGYVPNTSGPTLKFTDNGATIELEFLAIGQLCSATKHWLKQNDERTYLEQRFPAPDPQVDMQKALQLITAKQYEKALAILIPQYVFHDDSLQTKQSRYDAMRSTRTTSTPSGNREATVARSLIVFACARPPAITE